VLQCVAVCCSVLQCVAVCCSVLQCVAVWCSVLQCDVACVVDSLSSNASQGEMSNAAVRGLNSYVRYTAEAIRNSLIVLSVAFE